MLELKKAEWFDSLKEFDSDIIRETISDVKRTYKEEGIDGFPNMLKFYSTAKTKAKIRNENEKMEKRKREWGRLLGHKVDKEAVRNIRENIRKILGLKSINKEKN